MKDRTAQDLLAERRANVQEMRCGRDKTAAATLQAHIDEIDRELARRRERDQAIRAALVADLKL